MLSGFRDFILRGNVVELAVAVVIGAAFGAVITSFTKDILTPMLGLLGVPDFSHLTWTTPGGAVVAYGTFLNALEARRQRGVVETPTSKTCTECASEIPLTAKRCPFCTQPQLVTSSREGG